MRDYFGLKLDVKIVKTNSNGSSYYDPDDRVIYIANGPIAKLLRKKIGRSQKWLMGHELTHAFLDQYEHVKKDLENVFGSLDDDEYHGGALEELQHSLLGFDDEEYITARASLCGEEDLAEIGAFLYCNLDESRESVTVRRKIKAVKKAIQRAKW